MNNIDENDYSKAVESATNYQSAKISKEYIEVIKDEIKTLNRNINSTGKKYAAQKSNIAGGFIAEDFHKGTFNIDAAVKDKRIRAELPNSNTLGSADIVSTNGESFSAKYYSDSVRSAKSQATSHIEHHYRKVNSISFEEWMKNNGIDSDLKNASMYEGQGRIIPTEQLEGAKAYIERKIQKEAIIRPEQVAKYKETLNQLNDRLEIDGVKSKPLTKMDSTRIASESKNGEYSVEKDEITEKQLIIDNQVSLMEKSLKTGLTAASITLALEMTPEIIRILQSTVDNSGYDFSDFIEKLTDSGNKTASSMLLGTITTYIVGSNEVGIFGEMLQTASSETIAATVLIIFNSIKISANYTKGNISKSEMAYQISSQTVGVIGAAMGSAVLSFVPIIGTMVGSLVGSIIANTAFNQVNNMMLGIAIESGCTFFGLVDHSYEMPKEILEEIGYDVFDYFEIDYDTFEYSVFNYDTFNYHEIDYDEMEMVFLKRGVIGVNRIGYV